MTSFQLTFDYRCPFAKNIHLHVLAALRAGADFDVTFVPWTLSEGARPEGGLAVWNDPAYDGELWSLAASVSIRDQQPEYFWAAHEALFRARHEQAIRLTTPDEIDLVLAPLGVDITMVHADVASRRPHQVIGEHYNDFSKFEAFGVPTFVVENDATFVRYMTPPTDEPKESVRVIESIVSLITLQPELNEFKHTRLPF